VPGATNVEDLIDAPVVAVNGRRILVDGVPAGSTHAADELGRVEKVDELFQILRAKRALWRSVQPDKPFPGVAILQIDGGEPALVVKSVFQTAALAGYPNVSFLVHKLPAAGKAW
jgi:hypothetical protein